ncbi:MAG: hypothetical protein QOD60_574 [Solirubrobacterales bacterium]|nr:hypothetical protein [Solirubrobacterales bacterium]
MSEPIYPPPEQVRDLVPGRDSVTWDRAGDARGFLSAGYALILQVSHPTVGAGVGEHSDFKSDPWGRLFRTLDFVNVTLYGGPEAAADMCRRVREMHKRIKGTKPDGSRYHALEPEAYAWVHATLGEAIVSGHNHFGRPFSDEDMRQFWPEWRGIGRLLGVRERDLPEDWDGFRGYFDRMVEERLEDTQTTRDVLESLAKPTPPPLSGIAGRAARIAGIPAARYSSLATIGQLPPVLRERLGIRWTKPKQAEFRALGRASRSATPLMPASLRNMGPSYLRWRRKQIARGDATAGRDSRAPAAQAA